MGGAPDGDGIAGAAAAPDQLSLLRRPAPAPDGAPDRTRPSGRPLPLRLRCAALNPTVGDIEGNERRIAVAIEWAAADGVELLLLPELAICGYPPEDLLLRRSFLDACHDAVARLAGLTRESELTVLLGAPQLLGGRLYNAAVLLRDGKTQYVARKRQLPNYGVFDEKRYFDAAGEIAVAEIAGVRTGITICEDLWADEQLMGELRARGCGLVVNISASPYERGKPEGRRRLVARRAREAGCPLAYCNILGGQDELIFDGQHLIADAAGRILFEAPPFSQAMLTAGPGDEPMPPQAGDDELEEIYEALALALRDYVAKTGFDRALVGLSGGLDSALVALLARDALGAERVVTVVMPSPYSSEGTQADARRLARDLDLECREIPIGGLMRAYEEALEPELAGTAPDVTEENIQARIRGNLLMALSNKFGWLVLSTGNKSEMAVGYSTLYGDLAGGFAPLKDVPKTLAYELARWRAACGDFDAEALERIIARPPSAELRPGQRDTDSLPPYEALDPILEAYLEEGLDAAQIAARGHDPQRVERVVGMVSRAEYKRRQAPPGPKITARAFGRERRMPISCGWKEQAT